MRESARKCVTPIEVRWATQDDYRKTVYQVGTLFRVARPDSTKTIPNTVPSSGAPISLQEMTTE
jgi:hypothetical protein